LKNIITFSSNNNLIDTILKFDKNIELVNYNYDAVIESINFSNAIVIVDIDDEVLNLSSFLQDLSIYAKTNIFVISINCDRKNINLAAKYGATSFIVKPLNKKRYKSHVLPFLNDISNIEHNEVAFISDQNFNT